MDQASNAEKSLEDAKTESSGNPPTDTIGADSKTASQTRAEIESWVDELYRLNSDTYQDKIMDAVEDTCLDALMMTTTKLEDGDSERELYHVLYLVSTNIHNDSRVRSLLSEMASSSLCSIENINKVAAIMTVKFFDSGAVLEIMVQRMQRQADQVVTQAIQNAQSNVAMAARGIDLETALASRHKFKTEKAKPLTDLHLMTA